MSTSVSRELLDGWVTAGLITPEQSDAIWRFETDQPRSGARRVPLLAEVLGYAGGSLALGAVFALTATYWGRLGTPGRLAISGVVAAICLATGWWLSSSDAVRARRLGSFLLFVGVAVFGGFVGLAVAGSVVSDDPALPVAAGAAFACGLAVWWKRRTSLQLIAMTLAMAALIPALANVWNYDSLAGARLWGFGYIGFGALWCVMAQLGWLKPVETAWALGSLAVLSGPQLLALNLLDWGRESGAYLVIGGATSLVLLGVAVRLGRWTPLALGAAGVVVFTPQILYRWFGDTMGVPVVLLIAGLLLLAMSAVVIRLRTRIHKRTDAKGGRRT